MHRPLLTLEDNNLADKDVWHINSQCVCLFMVGTVWWRNKMLLILTAGPGSLTLWPGQAVFLLIIDDVIIKFPLITIHARVKPYGQIHHKHTGDYTEKSIDIYTVIAILFSLAIDSSNELWYVFRKNKQKLNIDRYISSLMK